MEGKELKLHDAEYRFVNIVWEEEPIPSGQLAKVCLEQLGWKRTTTYTVLKKLCDRGILQNLDTIVTSLVNREQVQRYESQSVLDRSFNGSLPRFIAAYMGDRKISEQERKEILELLAQHEEKPNDNR